MTPRHLPLLLLAVLTGALALVGDASARLAPRASTVSTTVSLTSYPANPTSATSATFTFTTSHATTTTCSLDGAAYSACSGHATYTGLVAGTHSFAVRATAGTIAKVASYSWTVATVPPSVPAGLAAAGQANAVALSWRASSDPIGGVGYTVYRNGTRIAQTSATIYLDARLSAASTYRYAVAAYDPAGNTSATSAQVIATTTGPQPLGVPGSWSLKFDDEFSGPSLDLTKWQPNWLAANNTSITPPDNSSDLNCIDPAQASVSGGVLHLGAAAQSCRADNNHLFSYASGLVNTYNSYRFAYGYLEARIDIPATASGTAANFPAFWANGTGTWPSTGELDVMEVLNSCGPGEGFHFHSSLGAFGGCASLPVTSGWHTFGADWQPGSVTYYYDGVAVGRITSGITGFPMFLVLNNSVDPTWGGPTLAPSDLQVDYVRVWQ